MSADATAMPSARHFFELDAIAASALFGRCDHFSSGTT
jgi:hypothetical protein